MTQLPRWQNVDKYFIITFYDFMSPRIWITEWREPCQTHSHTHTHTEVRTSNTPLHNSGWWQKLKPDKTCEI